MSKFILDPALRTQLGQYSEGVELIDERGLRVGFFIPAKAFQKMLANVTKHEVSNQELEQARQELLTTGGYNTAQALSYLSNLAMKSGQTS